MRLRFLLAFLLLSPLAAMSQTYFGVNGWCTVGAQATVTQGLSSSGTKPISGGTFSQNSGVLASYPKCTVTVYDTGTTNISNIYSNAGGNVLGNPFTGNTDGSFLFFGLAGCYDVVTSSGITTGSTMPQSKTYTDVCVGAGGGGGTVGPGTVNQIAKFVSVNNVGNSSGFDDGVGLVQWPIGLTSMGSAYGKLYPNSVNGTTSNYLACIDATSVTVAEVTTCPASTTKAIGIVHAGTAGITGNAQITMMGFDSCVFDNQTVVGDYVGPSTSTGGQCTDLGGTRPASFQGVGRVTTLNNGAGTPAIVDLGPWDLFSPGSSGFGQCAFDNANGYFSGGNLLCDQFVTDDGNGNLTAKSLGLTDATQAGFYYLKQGTQPAATPANTRMDTMPASVTTYTVIHPGVPCTVVNQAEVVQSTTTDSNGNTVEVMTCGNTGGTTPPQANDPTAPTLANQNAAGARSITYGIVTCEDGPACAYHSKLVTATIANANASPQVLLSAYMDQLYGYRCANVYVTADSGARTGVPGKVASCIGKQFIDTGGNGNGIAATDTNTTVLDPNGLTIPLPGCNSIPKAPSGIDGPPCSPAAEDEEWTWGNGTNLPGDATDPPYIWVNQGTATATLTNGELIIDRPTTGLISLSCLVRPVPASTPYTFVGAFAPNFLGNAGGSHTIAAMAFYEQSSGKLMVLGQNSPNSPSTFVIYKYTNTTTWSSGPMTGYITYPNFIYASFANDGTNITFKTSPDGIKYLQQFTEPKATFFTTAPSHIGFCVGAQSGEAAAQIDYLRRTQ